MNPYLLNIGPIPTAGMVVHSGDGEAWRESLEAAIAAGITGHDIDRLTEHGMPSANEEEVEDMRDEIDDLMAGIRAHKEAVRAALKLLDSDDVEEAIEALEVVEALAE